MVRSKSRGYYVERKLVELLSKKPGNYVFRVPVSGSRAPLKRSIAFPDVFLVNNEEDRIVAFEVKGTSKRSVRVKKDQLDKLARFLAPFKKYGRREAVVAVWFFREERWVFRRVDDASEDLVVSSEDPSDWTP